MSNNLKPLPAVAKKNILDYARSMVSNSTLQAISAILSPCCEPQLLSASVSCDPANAGNYILTLVFDTQLNYAGTGLFLLFLDNAVATVGSELGSPFFSFTSGSSTQTFSNVFSNLSSTGLVNVTAQLLMVTNADGSKSASNFFIPIPLTLPTC